MGKAAQLELLGRGAKWIWVVTAIFLAGALYCVWLLLSARNVLDGFGFSVFTLALLFFAWSIHTGATMARKGIAALTSPATRVQVTVKATQLESTTDYEGHLEWQRSRLILPLGASAEVLKLLVDQPTSMLAYPDAHSGLPVMLETDDAYLWLKAPLRRA